MMYNEKLAVAIKSAGKVLREFKDTVYVPFGAEYSILVKNLNSVRAIVKVSIDGQYIDETGEGFVVNANSDIELERFLKNGNMKQGNRFKFIERTGKIEEHRGIQVEDGLIRIEFQYEKRPPKVETITHIHHHHEDWYWPRKRYFIDPYYGGFYTSNTIGGTVGSSEGGEVKCSALRSAAGSVMNASFNAGSQSFAASADNLPTPDSLVNDAGITVAGSLSEQQFVKVEGFPLEETSHVMVLKLLGETAKGKKVVQAVTVKAKQKCTTCGHMNKANAKFCSECGTALEIV